MVRDMFTSVFRSDLKLVYSIFRSVAGSASSFSFPNFHYCSSLKETVSVYANYLRSHFAAFQAKALHSRAGSYLSELHQVSFSKESHSSPCSVLTSTVLLAAALHPFVFNCYWRRWSCLPHAEALSSPRHRSSPSHF